MPVRDLTFVWDEFYWTTRITAPDHPDPVPLVYAPEARGDEPLSEAELHTIGTAVDDLPVLWQALKAPLLTHYEELRAEPGGLDPEDLPAAASGDDVLALMELSEVMVHQILHGGHPYVGLVFACPWDDEHGLGVLMNGTRTVQIGGADTAHLLWIAQQDSEAG
ncbi:DUF6985 domain-containing protein [Actinomadura macrotermitis]|uniref:DUF6985 domain-containing protein n=1 Tax=Actinomadura macrotermitis TaxID=2585200 RepID=A0A7K0BQL6_9ACTN|nr:hypothetical protein [Actinomadura macrotermitis]MQY03459.1 hypothetical protein [Actinomadura macrotermitis]